MSAAEHGRTQYATPGVTSRWLPRSERGNVVILTNAKTRAFTIVSQHWNMQKSSLPSGTMCVIPPTAGAPKTDSLFKRNLIPSSALIAIQAGAQSHASDKLGFGNRTFAMSSKANPPTGNLSTGQTDCTLITTNLSSNPLLPCPGNSGLVSITHDHSTIIYLLTCGQGGQLQGRQPPSPRSSASEAVKRIAGGCEHIKSAGPAEAIRP